MPTVPTHTYEHTRDPSWGPSARWIVPVGLDLVCRRLFRLEVRGLHYFSRAPATIIAMTHRRDADIPLATAPVFDRRGLRVRGALPYFVAREDLLRPRFLRDYLAGLPSALRTAVGRFPLAPLLWACRARPMRRVPERTLGEVLEDVWLARGDFPLASVLRRKALERFSAWTGAPADTLPVSEALGARFRPLLNERYGVTRLRRSFFHELKPSEREVIRAQLDRFTDLLNAGEILVLAPEGVISLNGSFSRIRGALHHLVNASKARVRVLPVGISYDFMMTGRTRVFVDFGPELCDLRGQTRRQTHELARRALLHRMTITASQLASRGLVALRGLGAAGVSAAELDAWVGDEARRYAEAGAPVDPRLLAPASRRRRVSRLLRWCVRRGTLVATRKGWYAMRGDWKGARPDWRDPCGAFGYATNELDSLSEVYPELRGA